MLQFGLAAALEVLNAAIGGEACRVPESNGVLHAELVLERADNHLLRCGCAVSASGFGMEAHYVAAHFKHDVGTAWTGNSH